MDLKNPYKTNTQFLFCSNSESKNKTFLNFPDASVALDHPLSPLPTTKSRRSSFPDPAPSQPPPDTR